MAENKSLKYRKIVENKLQKIREYKIVKKLSPSEFIDDQKETYGIEVEDADNAQFREFLDIAWEHCESVETATKQLNLHLTKIRDTFKASDILPVIIIYYQCLNEMAKVEMAKNLAEYEEAFKLICIKRTKSFLKSCGKVMDLVPIDKRFDKFGPWQNDPLQNHLKLFLVLPDEQDFPANWRTDEKTTEFKVQAYEQDVNDSSKNLLNELGKNNESTLYSFLQSELKLSDVKQVERIVKIFNDRIVYTVEDLTMITDWEELFREFPAHRQKLQISIERYKNVLSSGGQMKLNDMRSSAELASDWHKVRLFLFYEAGMNKQFKVFIYFISK
jgi:hypothetical protein